MEAVMEELPPLVARAQAVARQAGFALSRDEAAPGRPSACLPGTGRFLAMLAAGCTGGRIGELGTGAGIGTAWLASAMPTDCALVTAESDERLAGLARELVAVGPRVVVVRGDALAVMSGRGPFDLLFADCAIRDEAGFDALVGLLRPGGRIVMDDLTPQCLLAPDSPLLAADLKRRFFTSPRLVSAEVVLPDLQNSLLVGTRKS
jgi:predicted O-methyltransferase YrrM